MSQHRLTRREVLARLDTQQQAIIMGHAVPMPVVIQTRDYNALARTIMDERQTAHRPPQRGSRRIE